MKEIRDPKPHEHPSPGGRSGGGRSRALDREKPLLRSHVTADQAPGLAGDCPSQRAEGRQG